jgi:hypothetical protein
MSSSPSLSVPPSMSPVEDPTAPPLVLVAGAVPMTKWSWARTRCARRAAPHLPSLSFHSEARCIAEPVEHPKPPPP